MGLVVLRHGEDRDHRDGAVFSLLPSRTLIEGSQVRIHVSGISAASRHFLAGGRHLTQSVRIVGDIRQDDQNMHPFFKRKVLRRRQRHARRRDTFYRRIVGKIHKQYGTVDGSRLLKTLDKKIGFLKRNTHRGKNHRELFILSPHLCLTGNLCRQLRVGHTGRGKDRQLLPADQCIQSIDGGNPCLDKLLRITSRRRVHRQTVDIPAFFRQDLRTAVDGLSQTVKDTSQHIRRYAKLHGPAQKTYLTVGQIDACRVFKQLQQRCVSVHFQHLAAAFFPVRQLYFSQFVVGDVFHSLYQHQRTGYFLYGPVFLRHVTNPPFRSARKSPLPVPSQPPHTVYPADLPAYICIVRSVHGRSF